MPKEITSSASYSPSPSNSINSSTQPAIKRQLIVETDGNNINIVKNETTGGLELAMILNLILNKLNLK